MLSSPESDVVFVELLRASPNVLLLRAAWVFSLALLVSSSHEQEHATTTFMPANATRLFLILTPILLAALLVVAHMSGHLHRLSPLHWTPSGAPPPPATGSPPALSEAQRATLAQRPHPQLAPLRPHERVAEFVRDPQRAAAARRLGAQPETRVFNEPEVPPPSPGSSTTAAPPASRQDSKPERDVKLDIVLDPGSYVLSNRCSNTRLYLRINTRTGKPFLAAKQQRMNKWLRRPAASSTASECSRLDAARLKILSMIITVEGVEHEHEPKAAKQQSSFEGQQRASASREPTPPTPPTQESGQRFQEQHVDTERPQVAEQLQQGNARNQTAPANKRKSNEVKLRANLTELYICFSQRGNLETRVNGSSQNCVFNELTLDHRHVKYQSALNSSWFLGFDELGNTISPAAPNTKPAPAGDAPKRPLPAKNAILNERCYQFTKLNRLSTSTQFFPEALELATGCDSAATDLRKPSADPNAPREAVRVYEEAEKALQAKRRGTSPMAHANEQLHGQLVVASQDHLFNMTRFRNILRYQLGRAASQSIVPEEATREDWPPTAKGSKSALAKTRRINHKHKLHSVSNMAPLVAAAA